ncbi:MAG: N-glycosylase, partial [Sulfurimonas sp. RIFOXYD2_FULL_37_8]
MKELIKRINGIDKNTKALIQQRLNEFKSFKDKNSEEWFSELCFCILTANSRAKTAINIQNELGPNGFINKKQSELVETIKRNKHRFHNNKAKYILEARKYKDIRSIIEGKSETEARAWIVANIKGLGYKEASHFLRNTGHFKLAILDRHIINLMFEHNLINSIPKPIKKSDYLL